MRIVCLGSGNVATHMALAFKSAGAEFLQIWSKTLSHAEVLAVQTGATATDKLKDIDRNADVYIIAVKDDAIVEIAEALKGIDGLIVHTSGATSIDVFKPAAIKHFGVLYPLQTFSKSKAVDFSKIPLCIEAGTAEIQILLKEVAKAISPLIYEVSSADRKLLHLAAVFACNFTNHLYHLGQEILQQSQLSFDLLRPLILETAEKVQTALPYDVQTGPAVRNDKHTLEKHLELLQNMPELAEIYKTLSKSIKKTYL
ncbi:Rossmann-like and DUF2520 domain-containing protein [Pedobacter sp.]|jgi:predicted short-subunit dehydrogenase-like oxidoreductase (DUF2520 family)|uniref:Rossmann-like and DUF2520 domain-containing protein n=1 Tax=Pedobacter sp. TaxID=1411316 RepID=UPI002C48FC05|nr:DUF2520 domain-containing protein [Pedobacter sp.]HWW37684.1 DUF2520 domain-containing protein [Pedobacter sp.]